MQFHCPAKSLVAGVGLSATCTPDDICADPVDESFVFPLRRLDEACVVWQSGFVRAPWIRLRQCRHRSRFATVAILRVKRCSSGRACANVRRGVARILAMTRMPKPTPDLPPLTAASEVSAIATDDARKYRRYTPMCPACRQSGRRHQRAPMSAQHYICVRCSMRWTAMAQIVDGSFKR